MGAAISKASLVLFELCNELFIAVSSGVVGIAILVQHGFVSHYFVRTVFITSLTIGCLYYVFQSSEKIDPSIDKVVVITGCDSGLGFSLAHHVSEIGFTVVAGFLNLESRGAKELKQCKNVIQVELDVTEERSVADAVEAIKQYLEDDNKRVLWAVVNNSGVMVFGEFEWLTENLIQHQIEVNLLGTFRFTKAICVLLRKYKGRIITVTSHCAKATLPGISVYGATKAGLQAWNDGLRVEMKKYGVNVVTFVPGSFIQKCNIMSRQVENVYEMSAALTSEQKQFYGDYFKRYNSYLSVLSNQNPPMKIDIPNLYNVFEGALMDVTPKVNYVNQNFKYAFYHAIFRYSPTSIRDYFVVKFMQMPEYHPEQFVPEGIA